MCFTWACYGKRQRYRSKRSSTRHAARGSCGLGRSHAGRLTSRVGLCWRLPRDLDTEFDGLITVSLAGAWRACSLTQCDSGTRTLAAIHSAAACRIHSHESLLSPTPAGGRHSCGFRKKSLHGEHLHKVVEITSYTVGAIVAHAVETLAMGWTTSYRTCPLRVSCSAGVACMIPPKTHSLAHAVRSCMFATACATFPMKKWHARVLVNVTHCHGRRWHRRLPAPSSSGR